MDYTFNNMARIGSDDCSLSQNNIQNVDAANYKLTNFFATDSHMINGISAALKQPNINFTGSHQIDIGGNNIDSNSYLLRDKSINNPKCRLNLYQRPFATIPYLGRGSSNPILEHQLQQGDRQSSKKTVVNSTEKSHMPLSNTPLIPSIANTITNPANLVEGVASEGWVRGGVPSRELTKDKDFFKN